MAIRAICFDLGGVVARISYHWAEILERAGLPIPKNISPRTLLQDMPAFDPYQKGEMTDTQYFHELAVYLGVSTYEQAKKLHNSILIEPFPGVHELVLDLNAAGFVTGCLSNTNAPHWEDLAISGRFPAIVDMHVKLASFQIDAVKPDSTAYTAFEEAAAAEPAEILLFDDSLPNCLAALDLGWDAQHIDPNGDPASQMAERLATVPRPTPM